MATPQDSIHILKRLLRALLLQMKTCCMTVCQNAHRCGFRARMLCAKILNGAYSHLFHWID
ncbi:unnamed protein product [Porites lobata]|uniref:Uncharacterized protein n=1 Tax=Porites lobata TaxID=104759 RepID=A0ABN8QW51_9CNID|nr:unnamed protein product [Porites lobata]